MRTNRDRDRIPELSDYEDQGFWKGIDATLLAAARDAESVEALITPDQTAR